MHPIQRQLLELADTTDLGMTTYYSLAKKLGVDHPYKVKFALLQLERTGYLIRNRRTGSISKPQRGHESSRLISIPFYGEVSCGQATALVDDEVKRYLKVSPSVIRTKNLSNVFALKAAGMSMNRADINGLPIMDGDYVLVEKIEPHQIKDGDYVISEIAGYANLKRYYKDSFQKRILLISESSEEQPPIIISAQDADDISEYQPIARALEVVPGLGI
jgi:SOS-response transcriptional repressor LexA